MGKIYSHSKDIEVDGVILRECNYCKKSLKLESFPKNKVCTLGRESACRSCRKERMPESVRERIKKNKRKDSKKKYHEDIEKSRENSRAIYKSGNWPSKGKMASRHSNRSLRDYHIKYKKKYEESEKSKLKHLKRTEEWRIKNKKRILAHAQVYNMIRAGRIKKPFKCPICNKKTNSRKMYLRLDDNLDYKNPHWLCSFCSGTQTINDNIKKGLV